MITGEEEDQPAADRTVRICQDDTPGRSDTMDLTWVLDKHLTSAPLSAKEKESLGTLDKKSWKQESAVLEELLQLAVEVCLQKQVEP